MSPTNVSLQTKRSICKIVAEQELIDKLIYHLSQMAEINNLAMADDLSDYSEISMTFKSAIKQPEEEFFLYGLDDAVGDDSSVEVDEFPTMPLAPTMLLAKVITLSTLIKYDKLILVVALQDTGASASIMELSMLPKVFWNHVESYSKLQMEKQLLFE